MSFDLPRPSEAAIRAVLRRYFPRHSDMDVEPLGDGWAFWAYRSGELALRFPRDAEFTQTLAAEAAVMGELALTLPLPVTAIQVHEDGPNGLPFTSHRLVPGVQVRELVRPLAAGSGARLGGFLRAMEAFPVARAIELGLRDLSPEERRDGRAGFYQDVTDRVLPLVDRRTAARVRLEFETFLDDSANFSWQGVVSHADIDERNVLANPDTGEITGVIDWGDICIGDPAGNFTGVIYGGLGAAGLADQVPDLLASLGLTQADLEAMRPRCRFYAFCWPLHEVLYTLETRDEAGLASALEYVSETVESKWLKA